MHMPERWGYVQFSDRPAGKESVALVEDANERVKWALRRLYYRQNTYRAAHGRYAATLEALNAADIHVEGIDFKPAMSTTASGYEITTPAFESTTVHITHDGRVWVAQ
jgi:hypothetical protein